MSLSAKSIRDLSEALAPEFLSYLEVEAADELNELLSTAVTAFLAEKVGDVSDELFYALAPAVLDQVRMVTEEELISCLVARSHGSL